MRPCFNLLQGPAAQKASNKINPTSLLSWKPHKHIQNGGSRLADDRLVGR